MKLLVKPNNPDVYELYRNHGNYNHGDSGLDLFFTDDVTMKYGQLGKIVSLEIKCEALNDEGTKNLTYYLYPRSSISKTPIRMSNSVGIIDAGYRGDICVALDHVDPTIPEYTIQKGTRLFQICSPTLEPINMELTDNLSDTERGNGGFGSTGQ